MMTESERLEWADRLEVEAFGRRVPDGAAYSANLGTFHVISLAWLLGSLPLSILIASVVASFQVFLGLACFMYVGGALMAYVVSKRSDTWDWYLSGANRFIKLSAIPPLATWRALQSASRESDDPAIQNLATRSWTDYQTALSALGRPAPRDSSLGSGFNDVARWLRIWV
jgi:hypothetical protein